MAFSDVPHDLYVRTPYPESIAEPLNASTASTRTAVLIAAKTHSP
jgi:hypothetical protein